MRASILTNMRTRIVGSVAFSALLTAPMVCASDKEDLAMQLNNPVAALISVPVQINYDANIGPDDDGERYQINMQPVVPFDLNDDWNLISRTILPVITQDEIAPGSGSQSGLGDTLQSVFFSPKAPTDSGWILGAGPVALLPTATDDLLGADKWGTGPTAIALKQDGPWTYGALTNHVWSFAGDGDRQDVNSTFMQPFLSYTTKNAVSYVINSESTYDWKSDQWSVPVNMLVTKVVAFGTQNVSLGGGLRYWAESSDNGPEGFGARLIVTFLFPK